MRLLLAYITAWFFFRQQDNVSIIKLVVLKNEIGAVVTCKVSTSLTRHLAYVLLFLRSFCVCWKFKRIVSPKGKQNQFGWKDLWPLAIRFRWWCHTFMYRQLVPISRFDTSQKRVMKAMGGLYFFNISLQQKQRFFTGFSIFNASKL